VLGRGGHEAKRQGALGALAVLQHEIRSTNAGRVVSTGHPALVLGRRVLQAPPRTRRYPPGCSVSASLQVGAHPVPLLGEQDALRRVPLSQTLARQKRSAAHCKLVLAVALRARVRRVRRDACKFAAVHAKIAGKGSRPRDGQNQSKMNSESNLCVSPNREGPSLAYQQLLTDWCRLWKRQATSI
jgi:hypothetical protein